MRRLPRASDEVGDRHALGRVTRHRDNVSLLSLHRRRIPVQPAAAVARAVDFSTLNYPHRLEVRGESFHLSALKRLQRVSDSWPARLVREPHNPYDCNAIAVHIQGEIVGHVAREQAAELAHTLDAWARERVVVEFDAVLYGGTKDKPNIGVFLND
jgi:hypothetical protein